MDNLFKHHVCLSISLFKEHAEFYPQTGNAKWRKCWAIHQSKIPLLVVIIIINMIPFSFWYGMGYF